MIIAGTGHRPPRLGLGYSDADRVRLRDFILPLLPECRLVVTGGAQGFDQALAWASSVKGIPYVVAAPFPGQQDRWPVEAREFYEWLVAGAEEYVEIRPSYSNAAYAERDRHMVDRADSVLALLDDGPEKSGTRLTVEYAMSKGKPVRNLWGEWEKR